MPRRRLETQEELEVPACSSSSTITIHGKWFTDHPDDLGMVVHEFVRELDRALRRGEDPMAVFPKTTGKDADALRAESLAENSDDARCGAPPMPFSWAFVLKRGDPACEVRQTRNRRSGLSRQVATQFTLDRGGESPVLLRPSRGLARGALDEASPRPWTEARAAAPRSSSACSYARRGSPRLAGVGCSCPIASILCSSQRRSGLPERSAQGCRNIVTHHNDAKSP